MYLLNKVIQTYIFGQSQLLLDEETIRLKFGTTGVSYIGAGAALVWLGALHLVIQIILLIVDV